MPPEATLPAVRRLRLTVAYDGGRFEGWQSQTRGNTVQDHLEAAFAALCAGQRVSVHGSGRTDAGVHARGQVAHADVPASARSLERWTLALNAHLPPEIRVAQVQYVPETFHARFLARGKVYEYRIWNSAVLDPFERGRAWHLPGPLDFPAFTAATSAFEGRHDFAAFAANRGTPPETTVRTIRRVRVTRRGGGGGGLITLRFEGDGFLYRMVRLMVGTAVRCAQDRTSVAAIAEALAAGPAARKTTFCAPAEGLCLLRVLYPRRAQPARQLDSQGGIPQIRRCSRAPGMKPWIIYALISMVFAGFTSVIAKLGLSGISGELGLTVRTCFVFVFVLAFAVVTVPGSQFFGLARGNYLWLGLSGVTTAVSWIFYYKAIKDGEVSTVALIDKGSVVVAVLLAFVILKEQITARTIAGAALMVAGLLVIARK